MNEPVGTPLPEPMPEAPRKNNQGLIIGIVAAVVLCCCCALVAGAWTFGDQILQYFNFSF